MAKRVVEIKREYNDRSWTYTTRYRRAEAARQSYEQQLEARRSGEDLRQAAELERKKQEAQERKKFEQLERQAWELRRKTLDLVYLCQRYGLDSLPEVKAIACFVEDQLPQTVAELESWINTVTALLAAGQPQVEYLQKEEQKECERQRRAERYEEFLDSFEHWDDRLYVGDHSRERMWVISYWREERSHRSWRDHMDLRRLWRRQAKKA